MQNSGFGLSALLTAGGAILAWAVEYQTEGVDLHMVGLIILFAGIGLAVVSLFTMLVGRRTTVDTATQSVIDGHPVIQERHDVVTER